MEVLKFFEQGHNNHYYFALVFTALTMCIDTVFKFSKVLKYMIPFNMHFIK